MALAGEATEPIERWVAKWRVALAVSLLKIDTSVAEALPQRPSARASEEGWREKFLFGAENALLTRPKDEDAVTDGQIKTLKQQMEALVLANDILREALNPTHLDRKTSDAFAPRDAPACAHAGLTQREGADFPESPVAPGRSRLSSAQEFITPDTPEQTGMIQRFFRSLKEECVWQHTFQTFEEARRIIWAWIHWYNESRPHSALGYRSPVQYWAQHSTRVA